MEDMYIHNLKLQLQTAQEEIRKLSEENKSLLQHLEYSNQQQFANTFSLEPDEVIMLIPEFNPQNDEDLTAHIWLNNIEKLKETYGWDDRSTIRYASLRLSGAARFWYFSSERHLHTFNAFKHEMIHRFPSTKNENEILRRMKNRTRNPHECVENYFYDVVALGKQTSLPYAEISFYIIAGLNNESMINHLMGTSFNDLNVLLKQIKEIENLQLKLPAHDKICEQDKVPYRSSSQNRNSDSGRSSRTNNHNHDESNQRPPKRKRSRMTKCFRCGDLGHESVDCPLKENRCFVCREMGHLSMNCPSKKKRVDKRNP